MKITFALLATLVACSPLLSARQAPNILLAVADDWGLHAGAYGTDWVKTPHFDRVAEQGLLFTRAYTPNAKCAPSRACILTGRNSWQLKAAANHWCFFPPEFKTWCEALAEQGWQVGHTQKGWAPGIALDESGDPRQLTGKAWNRQRAKPPTTGISGNNYAANFEDFLNAAPEGEPWVFWYGAGEPHRDYEFGSSLKQGRKPGEVDHVPAYWPDNASVRTDMLDYAIEVEHFDTHLGRMLATLEARGQLENTLVIVTSDHGMPFPRCKGQAYDDSNHVPFAVMWPKGIAQPSRRIEDYVSLIDLAPTVLELFGLSGQEHGMAPVTGISLTHWFNSPDKVTGDWPRQHVLIGKERHDIGRPNDWGYPIRGIIKGDVLYIRNCAPDRWPAGNPETGYLNSDGGATKTVVLEANRENLNTPPWDLCFGKRPPVELYDLKKDPHCLNNIIEALQAKDPALLEELTNTLIAELKSEDDPRMFGRGELFEQCLYADQARRGFYERYMQGEDIKTIWVNPSDYEPSETKSSSKENPAGHEYPKINNPKTVLALGDSITAGGNGYPTYRQFLAPELEKYGITFIGPRKGTYSAHAGYPGKDSGFLLEKLDEIYKKYPADIVLLHSGHNHQAKNKPVPQILKDTGAIVRAIHAMNPKAVILVAQAITSGKLPKYEYIPELNRELENLIPKLQEDSLPVVLVNQAKGFDWQTDALKDKVHPNLAGAEKMADCWLEALETLIKAQ